jgi:hypothetical protein
LHLPFFSKFKDIWRIHKIAIILPLSANDDICTSAIKLSPAILMALIRYPLDELVAAAAAEGYDLNKSESAPFYGYYIRMLTAQGPVAPGGKKSYVVSIQKWWISVQAKAAAISQPQA